MLEGMLEGMPERMGASPRGKILLRLSRYPKYMEGKDLESVERKDFRCCQLSWKT